MYYVKEVKSISKLLLIHVCFTRSPNKYYDKLTKSLHDVCLQYAYKGRLNLFVNVFTLFSIKNYHWKKRSRHFPAFLWVMKNTE